MTETIYWSDPPFEILRCILEHVGINEYAKNGAVYQCQLVCKGWYIAAQEELYRRVWLSTNATMFLESITRSRTKIGMHVKEVTFQGDFQHFIIQTRYFNPLLTSARTFKSCMRMTLQKRH